MPKLPRTNVYVAQYGLSSQKRYSEWKLWGLTLNFTDHTLGPYPPPKPKNPQQN